ncbi:hypothetical protein ACHAXA_005207 [Cyclostephanos tholiformis]|uniref:glutathione-disulfide reductase n=1 Tax=Cyclostephanos tholiformis TaxID=382380 RepID=A0ABD3SER8_9STRA
MSIAPKITSTKAIPVNAASARDYDLICIGGGSAGIACAKRAASLHNRKVLCIERSAYKLGGTCVNVGCVPKKVMFGAASIHQILSHDARHYGFDVDDGGSGGRCVGGDGCGGDGKGGGGGVAMKFDYSKLKKYRDEYVRRLNMIYSDGFVTSGVDCIYGNCSLIDERTVQVVVNDDGSGENYGDGGKTTIMTTKRYTANNIVIATGSRPNLPMGEGISEHCITSDGFFDMDTLPDVAVIVGAGYIAVELAGILNSLGSEVHLVMRGDKPLKSFDPMLRDGIDVEMRRSGIFVHRHTNGVSKVVLDDHAGCSKGKKNVTLVCGDVIYGADVVIMATGRMPNTEYLHSRNNRTSSSSGDDNDVDDDNGILWSGNTDGMGLEGCGVKLNSTGHVMVDEYQNTNVNGIYAIGDVCGRVELTPMAIAAGRRLADRLFGIDSRDRIAKVSYDLVPTVVFSHPVSKTIGTCGMTEPDAIRKYGKDNVRVYTSKFSNLYYGIFQTRPEDKPKTLMKLVCAGIDEKVVGMHVLGMGSDEMMQGFGVAMKMGCTKADLDSCVAIHPTASEEFVTMGVWGTSSQETGARVSPLGGAAPGEPRLG